MQFVSPHTGLVYQKHITGLCQFMQDEVEREVRRSQAFGESFVLEFGRSVTFIASSLLAGMRVTSRFYVEVQGGRQVHLLC